MKKTNFYFEASFKFEDKTHDEMVEFMKELDELANKHGNKHTLSRIKENPVYDSFGNLWE